MVLGISSADWLQLWSGVIGSFVAAVLGGLVALLVVRLTNSQQRRQAREEREIAAIADLVTATGMMLKKYRSGLDAIEELLLIAEGAATRLQMDTSDAGLRKEVEFWPYVVGQMAVEMHKVAGSDRHTEGFDLLVLGQMEILELLNWPRATARERRAILHRLAKQRSILGDKRQAFVSRVDTSDEASTLE